MTNKFHIYRNYRGKHVIEVHDISDVFELDSVVNGLGLNLNNYVILFNMHSRWGLYSVNEICSIAIYAPNDIKTMGETFDYFSRKTIFELLG